MVQLAACRGPESTWEVQACPAQESQPIDIPLQCNEEELAGFGGRSGWFGQQLPTTKRKKCYFPEI